MEVRDVSIKCIKYIFAHQQPYQISIPNSPLLHKIHPYLVHGDVQGPENEHEAAKGGIGADGAQPVVVEVEEQHLGLGGLEDEVAKLFDLERGLEGELQLRAGDDNVGKVQQVHLQRVQHALARDDDALGLLLYGQRADERGHLLGRLPLGQLAQALLPGPDRGVDDLQKQLPRARVEDEDGAVDGLGRQISLKGLVDGHAVDVGVVHKPDELVAEQLAVVLAAQVGLGRLGAVELQRLAHALAQHVHGRVALHDLGHGLRDERL